MYEWIIETNLSFRLCHKLIFSATKISAIDEKFGWQTKDKNDHKVHTLVHQFPPS